jgi:hypothetical protein
MPIARSQQCIGTPTDRRKLHAPKQTVLAPPNEEVGLGVWFDLLLWLEEMLIDMVRGLHQNLAMMPGGGVRRQYVESYGRAGIFFCEGNTGPAETSARQARAIHRFMLLQ